MSTDELTYQAQSEIDETHNALLKKIDAFNHEMTAKSEEIVNLIERKEDKFKKDIVSLNEFIASSQQRLEDLTNKYMTQQQDCTQSEKKINDINSKINELNNKKNIILPNKLHQISNANKLKSQYLHEKKLKLKNLILKNETKIKNLLSQCRLFEKCYGINCYVVENTQNIKISFKQIDKFHPEKQYFIIIGNVDDKYKIIQCYQGNENQNENIIRYLEHKLNSKQIGLSQFINIVRKYFVLITEKSNIMKNQ